MGRRFITDRLSWNDCNEYIAYVADALALAGEDGDKEVGALAPPVDKLVVRWDGLESERREKRRAVGRTHALVRRRNVQLDAATQSLHDDTLGVVRQDRSHPVFVRLFPDPVSIVIRMALESQLPESRKLALKLEEPETPAELRKANAKALGQAITQGEQAVKGREEAFATAGRVSARIAAWREDANHVLLGVEGALKQIASKRRLPGEWVDAFFPTVDRRRRGGEDDGGAGDGGGKDKDKDKGGKSGGGEG